MNKYLLFILLAFICTGCKKKNEPTPSTPPPVLLKSMKFVAPGTPDSLVNNYSYNYNPDNQLKNINMDGLNFPLVYNGSGQLVSYGGVSNGGIFMQFQYDQNKNPVSSTVTTYDQLSRVEDIQYFTYTIANGIVTQIKQLTGPSGELAETYNLTYDQAGNVIEENIFYADGSLRGTNKYTFGSHHSPYYTAHIKFYLSPDLDDYYFNPNEKLTQTSINALGTTQFNFTYTYNGLYPTSMTISANGVNNYYYYTYTGLK
jgi:YD repeat-containing protein